jgi:hypothetical protein
VEAAVSGYLDERRLARAMREGAISLERCASACRFYGLERHADRERRAAQAMRELAALCEWAPFEAVGLAPWSVSRAIWEDCA